MAHISLEAALAEISPEDCRKVIAEGINFAVLVLTERGLWISLHGESIGHANGLAHSWIDFHGAREAQIFRLYRDGIDATACHSLKRAIAA